MYFTKTLIKVFKNYLKNREKNKERYQKLSFCKYFLMLFFNTAKKEISVTNPLCLAFQCAQTAITEHQPRSRQRARKEDEDGAASGGEEGGKE